MENTPLEVNLEVLQRATGAVRFEFKPELPGPSHDAVKRFYHLLLLECAERMSPRDFRHAVDIAREQLRRPA